MRIRSSQKAVTNGTKDEIKDEGNNRENRSICNPPHKIHMEAICPVARGMFGKTQNWNEELNLERLGQFKRFEESMRRAQLVQKKLLAIGHHADADNDHTHEKDKTRMEDESEESSNERTGQGSKNNLESNEDESEEINQEALSTNRPQEEFHKTDVDPVCSKTRKEPCGKMTGGKPIEAQIPEIDLVTDSEEDEENSRKEIELKKRSTLVTPPRITLEVRIQNGEGSSSTVINLTTTEGTKRNGSTK